MKRGCAPALAASSLITSSRNADPTARGEGRGEAEGGGGGTREGGPARLVQSLPSFGGVSCPPRCLRSRSNYRLVAVLVLATFRRSLVSAYDRAGSTGYHVLYAPRLPLDRLPLTVAAWSPSPRRTALVCVPTYVSLPLPSPSLARADLSLPPSPPASARDAPRSRTPAPFVISARPGGRPPPSLRDRNHDFDSTVFYRYVQARRALRAARRYASPHRFR